MFNHKYLYAIISPYINSYILFDKIIKDLLMYIPKKYFYFKSFLITINIVFSVAAHAWTIELECSVNDYLYNYDTEDYGRRYVCLYRDKEDGVCYSSVYRVTPKLIGTSSTYNRSRRGELVRSYNSYTYEFHIDYINDDNNPNKIFYGVENTSRKNTEFYSMNHDASLIQIILGGWPLLYMEADGRANYVRTAKYNGEMCTNVEYDTGTCDYVLISEGTCVSRNLP